MMPSVIPARFRLGVALAFVVAVGSSSVTPISAASLTSTEPAAHPTFAQLIGQKLVVRWTDTPTRPARPHPARRGRRRGAARLQRHLAIPAPQLTRAPGRGGAGGQPPLLIGIDQEGGSVKRIPWAPPTITVPQMGRIGGASARGPRAGRRVPRSSAGINVDLAPVADVPRSTSVVHVPAGSDVFVRRDARRPTCGRIRRRLGSRGDLATMKHFPGIGLAKKNTDPYVETIAASKPRSPRICCRTDGDRA